MNRLFSSWENFLALGCGSGLSPVAPGTAGSVAAIPILLLLAQLPAVTYIGVVLIALALGIHICDLVVDESGIEDPGEVVWDEFVGFWITMTFVPLTWYWIAAAFLLFRLLDIAKPWPISYFDGLHGGRGIMLDDVVAGMIGCMILNIAVYAAGTVA